MLDYNVLKRRKNYLVFYTHNFNFDIFKKLTIFFRTSLGTKVHPGLADALTNIVVDAVLAIKKVKDLLFSIVHVYLRLKICVCGGNF